MSSNDKDEINLNKLPRKTYVFVAFHEGFRNDLGVCVPREYWVTVGARR